MRLREVGTRPSRASRAFLPPFVVGTVAALVSWWPTMSLGRELGLVTAPPLAGLVAGGVSADRGRLLGWIGGMSGVLVGLIAAQLAWSWTIDVFGLGLRWVVGFTAGYALMVAVATSVQKARGNRGA